MADPDEISQFIVEVAQTTGSDQDSQFVAQVFQTTGPDQDSQFIAQVFQTTGPDQVSQLTIELLRGPEVVPPTETPTETFAFDEGLGNTWFIALQLSDSGDELRDKVVKSFRVTGKMTNPKARVYGYGPQEDINVQDIEQGTNSKTGVIGMPDTTQVQQSRRFPINVKNAMMHTIRIDGIWDGSGLRDSIHEIVMEVARMGVRR